MKKSSLLCALVTYSLLLPPLAAAQLAKPQAGATQEMASITFTFNSACEDCAVQSVGAGDVRYLIDVPISNNPSPAKSNLPNDLNMEVRVQNDRIIYAIQIKPGTSPRAVWRGTGKVLQVFFVPPETTRDIAAHATSALETPVAETASTISAATATVPTNAIPSKIALASAPAVAAQPQSGASGLLPFNKPIDRDAKGSTAVAAVDMSIPESPAFTVLGLTPQTVTRPTSPREFATSLLNGVDMNGNFQSGLALDFVPYLLLAGDQLTLRGYQKQYVTRLLSRTQLSFATTKGASDDDKSMRLGLGLHMTLWDRGDPRTDKKLMGCLSDLRTPRPPQVLEPELPDHPTPEDLKVFTENLKLYEEDKARFERDKQAAIEFNNGVSSRCREESGKRNWNRSSWIVAAAPSWISETGETRNYRWNGGGFWTSLAYGFDGIAGLQEHSQVILHARYRNREQVPDPGTEGTFFTQDSTFFGARFRHGSPTFNGSFEYTFLRSRPAGKQFDNSSRLSLGFERRISGDTWFNLSLGGETGRADGKNKGFVLTSFKWAFSGRKDVPTQ